MDMRLRLTKTLFMRWLHVNDVQNENKHSESVLHIIAEVRTPLGNDISWNRRYFLLWQVADMTAFFLTFITFGNEGSAKGNTHNAFLTGLVPSNFKRSVGLKVFIALSSMSDKTDFFLWYQKQEKEHLMPHSHIETCVWTDFMPCKKLFAKFQVNY